MAIVSAGVHFSSVQRAVFEFVLFMDVQCIHVCAQADGTLARTSRQRPHHSRATQSVVHAQAEGLEFVCHQSGGALLLKRSFRVGMEVVAPLDHLPLQPPYFF